MNWHYVGTKTWPAVFGLLGDGLRFRIQRQTDSGTWDFMDANVYTLDRAMEIYADVEKDSYRLVKISWADVFAVHSVVRGPR